MMLTRQFWRRVGAVIAVAGFGVGVAWGEVRLLVVGGGPDVFHNEVFFEKNVRFFRETMGRVGMRGCAETVLFAGGGDVGATADISYRDPREAAPRVNQLLSRIFDGDGDVDVRYRPHEVKGVGGGATKKELVGWFEGEGKKLKDGDVLFLYVTAHGGGSSNALEVGKSTIALWPDDEISVGDFTGLLDKLPAGVRVVTVMVQCYCGGFGEIVFKAGLPPGRVSEASRVGFFATVATLPATGCTPDTQEETYADYSTYFFAALGLKDRVGREIALSRVDLDGDGRVSMAEAHAYAVGTAESVDIPTTTSELYLRRVSKVDGAAALKGMTFAELRGKADTVRGGILDGLGRELGLAAWKPSTAPATRVATTRVATTRASTTRVAVRGAGRGRGGNAPPRGVRSSAGGAVVAPATGPAGDWVVAAWGVMNEAVEKKKELDRRGEEIGKRYYQARDEIRKDVQGRWPELAVTWHPRVGELLKDGGGEVLAAIEGHASFKAFERAWGEWDAVRKEIDWVEARRARAQRFLRTAATVALERRLGEAKEEERATYRRLVEAEGVGLGGVGGGEGGVRGSNGVVGGAHPTGAGGGGGGVGW